MSFVVEDKGPSFESCPSGMHLARCYRIIDMGTQKSEYMGQVKYLHKIMLCWEVHGTDETGAPLKMSDGRPFAIFKNYTLSWSEKANLRLDLQSWRGKPFSQEEMRRFDLKNILGAWCMVNVIERQGNDGKTYTNVQSVSPVPAAMRQHLPTPVNKIELFNLQDPDMTVFETFSQGLQAKIKSSPEWLKLQGQPSREPGSDDEEIPF